MLKGFLSKLFGGENGNATSDARQAEIGAQVLALFQREQEDGRRRLSDSYWGAGANNVGHAVIKAVMLSVAALLERGDAPLSLSEAGSILEAMRKRHENDPDDEDGYGLGTFRALISGISQIADAEGPSATFSTKVLAAMAPQDSFDPTAWTAHIHAQLSEHSEFLRTLLDLYAAGDFAGVVQAISDQPHDQWPKGFLRNTTLLHVNCLIRQLGDAGVEHMRKTLESSDSQDHVLTQLLGLLIGSVSLDKFEVFYDDEPVMMCMAYYLCASRHLVREEFPQATAMLDKCLSMRLPLLESYLAWIDLIALEPTRGQAPS